MFAPRTKRESAPSRASAPRRAGKTQAQEAQVPAGLMPAWDLGTIAIASAIERERGGGRPLDEGTRREMETRFATDFSSVRVHVDERAAALAESMDAAAFTTGGDVFFGRVEAGPESMGGSARGNELVAHELAHVVQQRGGSSRAELTMGGAGDRHEQEATAAARQMQRGDFVLPSLSAAPAGLIQRRPKKAEDDKKKEPPKKTDAANPTPVKTWAGEFAATGFLAGSFGGSSYGAEIEITFTPNDQVDAEKIALVQAANSYRRRLAINHPAPLDDVREPSRVKSEEDPAVVRSRLVDDASDVWIRG